MSLYKDRGFLASVGAGLLLLVASIGAVFYSTNYAGISASNSVTDIVLSNTRVYEVDGLFIYGALALVAFISLLIVLRPAYLPFTLKGIALFYFVRSISVSLTHISPFPERVVLDASPYFVSSQFFRVFFTGDDLFFSGHVGLPFLLALIFWDNRGLRYLFLALSVMFAVVVLLGHLHYSIDVFAAYFITYAVYVLARRLFNSDFLRIAACPERSRGAHAAPVK